ncbi:MAG: SIMPL domain-containing protein [Patescibacteria group bacterium]
MGAFFNVRYNRAITALVILLLGVALASYAYGNYQMTKSMYPMPMNISVTGEGEVNAIPDIGQFSFTVTANGTEATMAQEAAATKINDILAYLKQEGIEEKDIKTENYNLFPKFRFEEQPCFEDLGTRSLSRATCLPGQEVPDGFEVSQTIAVKVRDTAKAGVLIAGVGNMGATNISSLTFTVDDTSKLKDEARSKAIADAKAKADKIAADLGVEIVRITNFYENEGYYGEAYGYGGGNDMMAKTESAVAPGTPVGEDTTKVSVSVSFEVE